MTKELRGLYRRYKTVTCLLKCTGASIYRRCIEESIQRFRNEDFVKR